MSTLLSATPPDLSMPSASLARPDSGLGAEYYRTKLARDKQEQRIKEQIQNAEEERRRTRRLLEEAEFRRNAENEREELLKKREAELVETARMEQAELDRQYRMDQERQQDAWLREYKEREQLERRLLAMSRERQLLEEEAAARQHIIKEARQARKEIRDEEQREWYEATRDSAYHDLHRELDEEDKARRLQIEQLRMLDQERQLEYSLEWARHRRLWAELDREKQAAEVRKHDVEMQREAERVLSEARLKELERQSALLSGCIVNEDSRMGRTAAFNAAVRATSTSPSKDTQTSPHESERASPMRPPPPPIRPLPVSPPARQAHHDQPYLRAHNDEAEVASSDDDFSPIKVMQQAKAAPAPDPIDALLQAERERKAIEREADEIIRAKMHIDTAPLDFELQHQRAVVENLSVRPQVETCTTTHALQSEMMHTHASSPTTRTTVHARTSSSPLKMRSQSPVRTLTATAPSPTRASPTGAATVTRLPRASPSPIQARGYAAAPPAALAAPIPSSSTATSSSPPLLGIQSPLQGGMQSPLRSGGEPPRSPSHPHGATQTPPPPPPPLLTHLRSPEPSIAITSPRDAVAVAPPPPPPPPPAPARSPARGMMTPEEVTAYVQQMLQPCFSRIPSHQPEPPAPPPVNSPHHPMSPLVGASLSPTSLAPPPPPPPPPMSLGGHGAGAAAAIAAVAASAAGEASPGVITEVVAEIRRLAEERDVERAKADELQRKLLESQLQVESILKEVRVEQQRSAEKQSEELLKRVENMNALKTDRDRAFSEIMYLRDQLERAMSEANTMRHALSSETTQPTNSTATLHSPLHSAHYRDSLELLRRTASPHRSPVRQHVSSPVHRPHSSTACLPSTVPSPSNGLLKELLKPSMEKLKTHVAALTGEPASSPLAVASPAKGNTVPVGGGDQTVLIEELTRKLKNTQDELQRVSSEKTTCTPRMRVFDHRGFYDHPSSSTAETFGQHDDPDSDWPRHHSIAKGLESEPGSLSTPRYAFGSSTPRFNVSQPSKRDKDLMCTVFKEPPAAEQYKPRTRSRSRTKRSGSPTLSRRSSSKGIPLHHHHHHHPGPLISPRRTRGGPSEYELAEARRRTDDVLRMTDPSALR